MKVSTPESTVTLKPPSGFKYDRNKAGWRLIENAKLVGEPTLSLAPFLEKNESYIKGDVMMKRAKAMGEDGNAGQHHAERLLEHQGTIPEEWRKYVLVFTGTVWRGSSSRPVVPYLIWDDDWWCLRFIWLGFDFHPKCLLVRLGK